MAYHVEIQVAAKTDTGLVRKHNEDSIAHDVESGLIVLADGMGGYNAGEVASAIATSTFQDGLTGQLQSRDWNTNGNHSKFVQHLLAGSVERINSVILEAARKEPQFSGMGTTLVAAVFHQNKITVAHVGDSRAYRLRRGALTQITRDHSVLQEQIDAGLIDPEMARFSANRNLITRAVGVDHKVDVEIHEHAIEIDDLYLLCSDGLSDMLSTFEIVDILDKTASNLDLSCEALVARANKNGGKDNISVILARVNSSPVIADGLSERLFKWLSGNSDLR